MTPSRDAAREADVIIVGGGPTGLMLAAELALARVDALIVERRENQDVLGSRAGGLHARTLELLDQRGVAARFLSQGKIMQLASIAQVQLDLADCPTRHPYGLVLVQKHIERILADWVSELGVRFLRGQEVLDVVQTADEVQVTLARGDTLRARYLVGCDGGRSLVRKRAGIAFDGWDASVSYLIAEASVAEEPPWGVRRGEKAVYGIGKMEGERRARIVLGEAQIADDGEPTVQDLQRALVVFYGRDFGVHDVTWLSRFSDMARQAASYRAGRIFVAGDAAHVHSPTGGQGLNTGVQDAFNLGWKLGLVVRGLAPDSLLDSYHLERHPVGAGVLRLTMALTALERGDARSDALRETMADLLRLDEAKRRYAAKLSGLDIHYDLGGSHALCGRRMPDLDLATSDGPRRVSELMRDGRALFIELAARRFDITPWGERLNHVSAGFEGSLRLPVLGEVSTPEAVLVRPDGHVAWAFTPECDDPTEALHTWLGPAAG